MESEELLSQEEMDALLEMIEEEPEFQTGYGHSEQNRLHLTCVDLAREIAQLLSKELRLMLTGELASIEDVSFGALLARMPDPCVLYPILWTQEHERLIGVLEIEPRLATLIFERMLGSTGVVSAQGTRPSSTVLALIQATMHGIHEFVRNALARHTLEPYSASSLGSGSTNLRAFADQDESHIVKVIQFSFAGEIEEAHLRLALSPAALRNERVTTRAHPAEPTRRAAMELPLRVRAILGHAKLSLRDLVHLEIGDVLCLGTHIDSDVSLEVQNKPRLYGRIGERRGRYAVRITRRSGEPGEQKKPIL